MNLSDFSPNHPKMKTSANDYSLGSSFRDPSGEVFKKDGVIYRNIDSSYKNDYELLMDSGLYRKLTDERLLIPHSEVKPISEGIYKTLRPEQIPFISYPYEWCFSQLKDAAITTLRIQKTALEYGMSLKDANCFNIQFYNGLPTLIDTLSFEKYQPGQPWIAYQQFCTNFLSPLLLMSYRNENLNKMLQDFIDGIPLGIASALLPLKTLANPGVLTHIHIHSKAHGHFKQNGKQKESGSISRNGLLGLVDHLESTVNKLRLNVKKTTWGDYYSEFSYNDRNYAEKKKIVLDLIHGISPKSVWDLGANTGEFSHDIAREGILTISSDNDALAVERNYLYCRENKIAACLPLTIDITNPTPALGWANKERQSFVQRGPADVVLALALIHHLTLTSNIPFALSASFFASICKNLIIEFPEPGDSQVLRLKAHLKTVFHEYNREAFERSFGKYFEIKKTIGLKGISRTVYLMQNRHELP